VFGGSRARSIQTAPGAAGVEAGEERSVAAFNVYMLVFRLLHIAAGVVWAGSLFLLVVFVQPSAAAIAPAGAPFIAELLGRRRLVDRIIGVGVLTVIAGLFLYWHDWQAYGSLGDFAGSAFGTAITIGALASVAALAVGIVATRPNVMRLLAIGRAAAEAGGPTPEQAADMAAIQGRLKVFARTSLALLALAVFAMATARYW
jgi:uncharacterized membrane protein